jgi:peroxiredoxin (alkyl hydroperoxide reductase subunit C)
MRIGSKVDNFSLEAFHNNDIKKVNLSDFREKWIILFFYPADFTFICPTELIALSKNYTAFKELGAEVLSVSRDTPFVHKAWCENDSRLSGIKFPMLSDVKGKLIEYFDFFDKNEDLSMRGTAIIDPEMVIKSIEVNDNSIGRNIDEILRKLRAAIHVSKNSNEVCPVNWDITKETLILPELSIFNK